MSVTTTEQLTHFLNQLTISSNPKILIAQKYCSLLSSQDFQLQYCRLYLHYLGLKRRVDEEEKQVGELKRVVEERKKIKMEDEMKKKRKEVITIEGNVEACEKNNGLKQEKKEMKSQHLAQNQVQHRQQQRQAQILNLEDNLQEQIMHTEQPNTPDPMIPSQILQTPPQSRRAKRPRRSIQQINRCWQCPLSTCDKRYGSQGSLKQHMKIKHLRWLMTGEESNQENKRGRQNFDDLIERIKLDYEATVEKEIRN